MNVVGPICETFVEESIFLAGSVTAIILIRILGPVIVPAGGASLLDEIVFFKEPKVETCHGTGKNNTGIKGLVDEGVSEYSL